MTGPSKKMLVSDEVFYELSQASEYSSDSEINVKIFSGGESSEVNGKVPVLMRHMRVVVSFTPRPLHPWGKSPQYPLDRRLGIPTPEPVCKMWREKILDPTRT
jgi:hypothetical protein